MNEKVLAKTKKVVVPQDCEIIATQGPEEIGVENNNTRITE